METTYRARGAPNSGVRQRLRGVLSLLGTLWLAPVWAAEPTAGGTGCAKSRVAQSRQHASRLYREGRYAEAVELLRREKDACWSALETTDQGWLVSDLGLAALRAGQPELCRKVLAEAPAALAPQSKVAKALAHNRGLCQGDGTLAVQVYGGLMISSPEQVAGALTREWNYFIRLREGRLPQRSEREVDQCTETEGVEMEDLAVTSAIDIGAVQGQLLRCRGLRRLTGARPSRVSHVRDLLSMKAPGAVLPADLAPMFFPGDVEARSRASAAGHTWSRLDPQVRFDPDSDRPQSLWVRGKRVHGTLERWALGDFNGDGFEDVLLLRSMSPIGGSASDLAAFLLTRTQPGGAMTLLEQME